MDETQNLRDLVVFQFEVSAQGAYRGRQASRSSWTGETRRPGSAAVSDLACAREGFSNSRKVTA